MLTKDKKGLLIFESFEINYSLPKYQENDTEDVLEDDSGITMKEARWGSDGLSIVQGSLQPWYVRWFVRLFKRSSEPPRPTLSIPEFFAAVKGAKAELTGVEQRAKGYEKLLQNAIKNSQRALAERLRDNLIATRSEVHLIDMGLKTFLEEKDVAAFVKRCPKGLRLDWVANFLRIIPLEIQAVKEACDKRMLFDNYVVLHYDPKGKSWAETEAEKQARKDPILFGVIKGVRKLYFIGDWVDEVCDLTLEQLAETVGVGVLVDEFGG